ncbi:MAG: YHS domain-containing protein [Anaerolineae bacterium]
MAKDVVCGMEVDPKTAATKAEYEGKTYYFCAPGCKVAFEKDPEMKLIPIARSRRLPGRGLGSDWRLLKDEQTVIVDNRFGRLGRAAGRLRCV